MNQMNQWITHTQNIEQKLTGSVHSTEIKAHRKTMKILKSWIVKALDHGTTRNKNQTHTYQHKKSKRAMTEGSFLKLLNWDTIVASSLSSSDKPFLALSWLSRQVKSWKNKIKWVNYFWKDRS